MHRHCLAEEEIFLDRTYHFNAFSRLCAFNEFLLEANTARTLATQRRAESLDLPAPFQGGLKLGLGRVETTGHACVHSSSALVEASLQDLVSSSGQRKTGAGSEHVQNTSPSGAAVALKS